MKKQIEINEWFKKALAYVEDTDGHAFITGKAGTGKSTLLEYFRQTTQKRVVVLAPTGVAAVNVRGQTIHSFFRFRPDITVEKVKTKYRNIRSDDLYKKLDTIVIDEISMVRADLLDCVDAFLRMHGSKKGVPFGGAQMLFIGDLYQLPPVVSGDERELFRSHYESPYFFDAHGFSELAIEIFELEKIYRQRDDAFIAILNGIRNRSIDDALFSQLNARVDQSFEPQRTDPYVHLTTTNAKAEEINAGELAKLSAKRWIFEAVRSGDFDNRSFPAPMTLELKIGSQVMLTNNDELRRWVNGTVGVVETIEENDENETIVRVKLEDGELVDISPHTWDMFRFIYSPKTGKIDTETTGSFTQYPMILAWAVTIHKAQGKTFERVIVDMDRGAFAHGQTYVALSRATSLSGLVLKKPIEKRHLLLDWRVVKFLTGFQYRKSDAAQSLREKKQMIENAIENSRELEIVYLKSNDQKSTRIIGPKEIGEMEYLGKSFLGVSVYDHLRKEDRVFRVDRILEMKMV